MDDLAALPESLMSRLLRDFLHAPCDLRLGAAQEALAVGEALAARVQAPIDDVHTAAYRLSRQPAGR